MVTASRRAKSYSSKDINTLNYPDNVRHFPTMYIGDTNADGLFLILRELLDNVVDEFLAGRATSVHTYVSGNDYWVYDDGQGIPQGIKTSIIHVNGKEVKSKMETMQAVFGALHTSGKHGTAYTNSRGVHGVGIKATNALSDSLEAWTNHNGAWYYIKFEKGRLVKSVTKGIKPKSNPFGLTINKGTLIKYSPDLTIFSKAKISAAPLLEWSLITSYLQPGFKVVVHGAKGKKEFYSKRGPLDYLDSRLEQLKATPIGKSAFQYHDPLIDVVVSFTEYDGNDLRGFTNGLVNNEGGTHINVVQDGMFRALKGFAKRNQNFTAHEFRDGLVGIVNAKLSGAKFSSQAKVRLADERFGKSVEELIFSSAKAFFTKNKKLALDICTRCTRIKELKTSFQTSKRGLKKLRDTKRIGLPAKYAGYHHNTKPMERELFLVEGDSAAGTLKRARGKHQAVLPLRGKISNALKTQTSKIMESDEIINILAAIGVDPGAKDPYARMAVGKIICLADPDPDGKHINTLLLTLFYKYMPSLFDRGLIYLVDAPEFYSQYKNKIVSGPTLSSVRKQLDKLKAPKTVNIQHIKGWGEIDEEEIKLFALDDTRNLLKMQKGKEDGNFVKLMNEDVQFRKNLLGI